MYLVVNRAAAALDAACGGLGLSRVLSCQCEPARRAGRVQIVLADFEPAAWPVSLVYVAQGRLPIKLRAFLDFAAPRLRAQLAGGGGLVLVCLSTGKQYCKTAVLA